MLKYKKKIQINLFLWFTAHLIVLCHAGTLGIEQSEALIQNKTCMHDKKTKLKFGVAEILELAISFA